MCDADRAIKDKESVQNCQAMLMRRGVLQLGKMLEIALSGKIVSFFIPFYPKILNLGSYNRGKQF